MSQTMSPRKALAQIRKLLRSTDYAQVVQGAQLADSLNLPAVNKTLYAGVSVSETGPKWTRESELTRRVRAEFRPRIALRFARNAGLLDALTTLDLTLEEDEQLDLSALEGLTTLETLRLGNMPDISAMLPSINRIPGLRHLHIEGLGGVLNLAALGDLRLVSLRIGWAEQLCTLHGLDPERLESLVLQGVDSLRDLSALRDARVLHTLSVITAHALTDLTPLARLPALQTLTLYYPGGRDFSVLSTLPSLRTLSLASLHVTDELSLSGLAGLTGLDLSESELTTLEGLRSLTGLTALNLKGCTRLTDISAVAAMTGLEHLNLSGDDEREGLESFSRSFGGSLSRRRKREDLPKLSHLAGLTQLKTLQLGETLPSEFPHLRALTGLNEGVSLDAQGAPLHHGESLTSEQLHIRLHVEDDVLLPARELDLTGARNMDDLDALARFTAVERLDVTDCRYIEDAFGLIPLAALSRLTTHGCINLKPRPPLTKLTDHAAVTRYRCHLARTLARQGAQTPAQSALLAEAERLGLLD